MTTRNKPIRNMTAYLSMKFNTTWGANCVNKYKNPLAIALLEALVIKLQAKA